MAITPVAGSALTTSKGTWSHGPTTFAYQWQRSPDGASWSNVGTNATQYVVAAADVGYVIRVIVTATNGAGYAASQTSAATIPAAVGTYWGAAAIGTNFTGGAPPFDMTAQTAWENADAGGKHAPILAWGGSFHNVAFYGPGGYDVFNTGMMNVIRNAGYIPHFSWSSDSDTGTAGYLPADIAGGSQDAYITQWAQDAAAWGHPFFLRFDWEMNGGWFSWGSSNAAADYVAMWRHVHGIFVANGATNAKWVWCPNVDPAHTLKGLNILYPGDAYVDWTGLDGYNSNSPWTTFHDLFASTYATILGLAPSKPMMICEVATTETGGSKSQWITDLFAALPGSFPACRGVLWYNRADGAINGHSDWPIESSASAQAAFAAAVAPTSYYANAFANLSADP